MQRIINKWKFGLEALLFDDLISYYTFFTILFTECFYLFAFHNLGVAIKLSAVLIGYVVTVLIAARLKSSIDLASLVYLIMFLALLVVGCFINWKLCIILTLTPLIITSIFITLREIQDGCDVFENEIFNKIVEGILILMIVGIPFVLFTVFFCMISEIPYILKIIFPIEYLIICPFISAIEDDWAACNIFELLFE